MEDDLYCKIIRDLASVGYNGRIAFHSNNEPFLDNNIVNRIKYARSACQKSHLFMYTNGTLLNDNLLDMVANSGLNHLVVDWYSDNLTLDSEIERMLRQTADVYSSRQQAFRISVYVRKKTEILSNRGGNAPNKMASAGLDHSLLMKMGCTLPFRQIVIRPSGKISLCCNDVFGEATAGDLNENHIVDVWNGAFFSKIREELMRNGRSGLSICRRCDVADIKIRRLFSAYYGDIVRLFL
jgi:radical SAM protein with 4Fe4S-binding SPASM domain